MINTLILTLSLLLYSSFSIAKISAANTESSEWQYVNEYVKSLVQDKQIAGATLLVSQSGAPIFFNTYGMQNREKNIDMKKDAIFRIYSIDQTYHSSRFDEALGTR